MKTINLSTISADLERLINPTLSPDTGKDDGDRDDPHRDFSIVIGDQPIPLFGARFCDPPTWICGSATCPLCGY